LTTVIQENLKKVFSSFTEYLNEGEEINKSKVIEDLKKYEPNLIQALFANEVINHHFVMKLGDIQTIKIDEIISQVKYKEYFENSYTKYANQIGLSTENKFLSYNSDIVLDFPYKDCVLEGGMTREDLGKKEIFFNKVLAKEEIDFLLDKKTFTNPKLYTKDGITDVSKYNDENLVIKGNNLMALHSLKEHFARKIKLILIDPPYNTENDSFRYNDKFNHSTWLTFMKNRLEVAKELLSETGSICVLIDHQELSYLNVLMDEIFGKDNLKNIVTVKRSSVSGAKVINPGVVNVSDYLLIYSKNKKMWEGNKVYREKERDDRYNKLIMNPHEDPEKWQYESILDGFARHAGVPKAQLKKHFGDSYIEELDTFIYSNKDRVIRFASLDDRQIAKNVREIKYISKEDDSKTYIVERENYNDYYLYKGEAILFFRDRLIEVDGQIKFGELISDIWDDVLPNDLHNEGGVTLRKGKKTEKLIERIIKLCTNEGEWVLDFFAGSGTTAAVAMKTSRKFITVEQLDYIDEITLKRLENVIDGDATGVSRANNWSGGGSFIYTQLKKINYSLVEKILNSTETQDFVSILEAIKKSNFYNYRIQFEKLDLSIEEFNSLKLEEKQSILLKILDLNNLYLNLSEIEDEDYKITELDKKFNYSFYL
jgi:adenine-specific DNA-methyltransferase